MKRQLYIAFLLSIIIFSSCNQKIGKGLFKTQTPHQAYNQRLKDAGFDNSPMYLKWVDAASRSLSKPLGISIPYQEKAYFASEEPEAAGFVFDVKSGEQLHVQLSTKGLDSATLFVDLFEFSADSMQSHYHLYSSKPGETQFSYLIEEDARYLLRIQPELLTTVSYELRITAGSSLANPIAQGARQNIGSFFGAGRDAGARKHEGIDIFATRSTPAVAAAAGTIASVGTNNLGGKVVFLRPDGRSINLYYAHLDSQLVTPGQRVAIGDTIGLVGNTGNAITTAPHLHFGIYTSRGAIDPLPFIKTNKLTPAKILADTKNIGDTVRLTTGNSAVAANAVAIIEAATQHSYRVRLPDRSKVMVVGTKVQAVKKPIRSLTLSSQQSVYKDPDLQSAVIADYKSGTRISIIGNYNEFHLVQKENTRGWMKM